jgi:hypothetical protein
MYKQTGLCIKDYEAEYINFRKISIAKLFHDTIGDMMRKDIEYQNHLKERKSTQEA